MAKPADEVIFILPADRADVCIARKMIFKHEKINKICKFAIFYCPYILYTVIPVNSKQALEDSYNQHRDEVSILILQIKEILYP